MISILPPTPGDLVTELLGLPISRGHAANITAKKAPAMSGHSTRREVAHAHGVSLQGIELGPKGVPSQGHEHFRSWEHPAHARRSRTDRVSPLCLLHAASVKHPTFLLPTHPVVRLGRAAAVLLVREDRSRREHSRRLSPGQRSLCHVHALHSSRTLPPAAATLPLPAFQIDCFTTQTMLIFPSKGCCQT